MEPRQQWRGNLAAACDRTRRDELQWSRANNGAETLGAITVHPLFLNASMEPRQQWRGNTFLPVARNAWITCFNGAAPTMARKLVPRLSATVRQFVASMEPRQQWRGNTMQGLRLQGSS